MEQWVKQDGKINIGKNIREIRLSRNMKQTELVRLVQLQDVPLIRETLVKIERGAHHVTASQLKAIRDALETTYDELLKENKQNVSHNGNS